MYPKNSPPGGPGSNFNEGILQTPKPGPLTEEVKCHTPDTLLREGTVSVSLALAIWDVNNFPSTLEAAF